MNERNNKNNFSNPEIAILLFVIAVLVLGFFESKKVITWETPRETENHYNIFQSMILSYASFSEKIKSELGLNNFFEKENNFWLKIKKYPLIFKENQIISPGENEKEEPEIKLPIKPESPFRILIIGDSFIAVWGGVGEILEGELINYKDVTVKRIGEVSSGLSRPDYFDWKSKARELILEEKPNIVIIMVGSNDAQSLTINLDGKNIILNYGTEDWDKEYTKRVSDFLKIFEENNIFVFWIGFPVMKNKTYSEKIRHLNSIYEKEIQNHRGTSFISIWDFLADENGNYTDYLLDDKGKYKLVRLRDGIHLSHFGGEIVVKEVIEKMEEKIRLETK
jgi:hypothetical protein